MLTINKTADGEVTVCLDGRLDIDSAEQLETELRKALKKTKLLVFDLQNLKYISSAGLRVLLSAQKRMNMQGRMRLVNVGDTIMQTLERRGLDDIFNIAAPD